MTKPRQLTGGHDPPGPAADARYTLIGELARGGLGRVFAASDDAWGGRWHQAAAAGSAEAVGAFEREAKITARLQHAGVVPVYDVGLLRRGRAVLRDEDGRGPLAAELIASAAALDERLALLPRVLAVADTMAYAHSRGVIHRDLKPANVIVGDLRRDRGHRLGPGATGLQRPSGDDLTPNPTCPS